MSELTRQSYPIGYEDGHWTFRVNGGPAFAMNAALSCKIAARDAAGNPARVAVLNRLADAIEAAMPE